MTAILTYTGLVRETPEIWKPVVVNDKCGWLYIEATGDVKLFPNEQAARIYCHMERITEFELCEYTFDNSIFGRWGNGVR